MDEKYIVPFERCRQRFQPLPLVRTNRFMGATIRCAHVQDLSREDLPFVISPDGWQVEWYQAVGRFTRLECAGQNIAKVYSQIDTTRFNVCQHRFKGG